MAEQVDVLQNLESGLQAYLQHMTSCRRCSRHTATAYRTDGEQFVAWCRANLVTLEADAVTRQVIVRYLESLRHLASNTVRRKAHVLSGWFRHLHMSGAIGSNPATDLALPARSRKLPSVPSPTDCAQLLAAARSPLERACLGLLLTAGLRRAELIGLDLGDLTQACDEIRVRGKGNRERLVPLPEQTQQTLSDYLEIRGRAPGALLLNRAGKRLGTTSLRRLFTSVCRRSGLGERGLTLHSARHAYATALVRAGVDVATVRDLLGHSSLAVTSVYLHSDQRSRRAAAEMLPYVHVAEGGNHE